MFTTIIITPLMLTGEPMQVGSTLILVVAI